MSTVAPDLRPVELGPNQPRQFYRGGAAIAELRGSAPGDGFRPEDWVASCTTRYELAPDGLARLPDGRYLRDAVEAEPEAWLGPEHRAYFGASPALLVKLLDAGERLPVHYHPDRSFAARHLGCRHGKTEAWVVLAARGPEPCVWLGWRKDVEAPEVAGWVSSQDRSAMLSSLNKLTVRRGDAVLVPAGTPHAIGEGVFCVELQEPTDFSIMLEHEGFDLGPVTGDLGLGWATALSCLRYKALTPADIAAVTRSRGEAADGVEDVLPPASRPYFRAQRAQGGAGVTLDAAFAVVVVVEGDGQMAGSGWELSLRRGMTVVVPYAAGPWTVSGKVELLRCLPPRPEDAAQDDPAR